MPSIAQKLQNRRRIAHLRREVNRATRSVRVRTPMDVRLPADRPIHIPYA